LFVGMRHADVRRGPSPLRRRRGQRPPPPSRLRS
jgi:hypothetical protein